MARLAERTTVRSRLGGIARVPFTAIATVAACVNLAWATLQAGHKTAHKLRAQRRTERGVYQWAIW